MKHLKNFLKENEIMATPGNTMGLGDVQLPSTETFGVDAIPKKKNKQTKKRKD